MRAVETGSLVDGDQMPSSRAFASTYQVARSSVVEAYEELCGIGVLTAVHGSGTTVSPGAHELVAPQGRPCDAVNSRGGRVRRAPLDLTVPGGANGSVINLREWNRAWRDAVDPTCQESGATTLQRVLRDHLRSFRGVVLDTQRLVLRPSLGSALSDVVYGMNLYGHGVAIEDPGHPRIARHLVNAGCRVHCVPVDDDGLRVDLLSADDRAVHVTPARQWPTGVPMTEVRRRQLLEWARRTGGIIIENDQDAEFTYGHAPSPTLYSMAPEGVTVVYLGASSKLITADLHVVWMAVPGSFRRRADDVAPVSDYSARALANYISSGALYRHRNRALHLYQERRDALVRALNAATPEVLVVGEPSGTELLLVLPQGFDELSIQMGLEDAGFCVSTLGDFALRRHAPAILLQYGELPPSMAPCFAAVLAELLDDEDVAINL